MALTLAGFRVRVFQSQLSMNANPQLSIDDDVPPAGTPCSACKATGHFCQASTWCAGDGGHAICTACLEMRECETILARKPRPLFESDLEPAPIRSIPEIRLQVA